MPVTAETRAEWYALGVAEARDYATTAPPAERPAVIASCRGYWSDPRYVADPRRAYWLGVARELRRHDQLDDVQRSRYAIRRSCEVSL